LWQSKGGKMLVLVCYDVSTETKAGRRRLRRVAKVCEGIGQRVQKSIFECHLDVEQFEALERELLSEIDPKIDCLRLYRIPATRGFEVLEHGAFIAVDFDAPLVL
jgi:CRISPR-associated protein Cas2